MPPLCWSASVSVKAPLFYVFFILWFVVAKSPRCFRQRGLIRKEKYGIGRESVISDSDVGAAGDNDGERLVGVEDDVCFCEGADFGIQREESTLAVILARVDFHFFNHNLNLDGLGAGIAVVHEVQATHEAAIARHGIVPASGVRELNVTRGAFRGCDGERAGRDVA